MTASETLKQQISTLPDLPGVYQYFNVNDEIIYVGKAKNLKKRVSSYFNKVHEYGKTNVLVKNISYLKYIVVDTEEDALLLENNLIKQYQPRYNVLLKDGKTYPSICITNEPFPRVFKTRNIIKNGSLYYGPYSSNFTINSLLEIIHQLYPIRTCRLPLFDENIKKGKFKVCLQYHIHKCNGPCEAKETIDEYRKHIDAVKKIIEGDANEISRFLLDEMKILASEYKFEEAHLVKQKYELIENYKSKSVISNTILEDTDVFAYDENENSAFVNILRISKGSIVQGYTIEYRKRLDEEKEDILAMAVVELRSRLNSKSTEIVLPFHINFTISNAKILVPQRGDRKKLLDLSLQNVRQYKLDKLKQSEKLNPDQRAIQLLESIKERLQLPKLPMHIECFDNSNIQGSDAVAACVVYKKAKPAKSEYRKYTIKTVSGPDDYASMKEVVFRRYSRLLNEASPLPDLIVADGGVGQMEIIRQVIEDELKLDIPIAGMAKDSKHRTNEILYGFPPMAVGLKPTDQLFKFFAGLQDEVHRFAIKFHREKRSKSQTASELDSIPGIGEKTKTDLLKHFKSLKRISLATEAELQEVVGKSRSSVVYNYFQAKLSL
ncbi:MAG: excinuclease ABC subunit UvrC [Paludibacter sp.]|nr:excinuclease ABC subunit UvrC [Paludibacter sp.]MBP8782633.1 excinuclease ABC subunit UvrC [Paludibacter sp.]